MQFLAWIERVEIKLLWRIDDDGGIDGNRLKCWENIKNLYHQLCMIEDVNS